MEIEMKNLNAPSKTKRTLAIRNAIRKIWKKGAVTSRYGATVRNPGSVKNGHYAIIGADIVRPTMQ